MFISNFRKILDEARKSREERRKGNLPRIFVGMQRSKEDRSIIDKLRSLKKHHLISDYDRDDISGKFKIRYSNIESFFLFFTIIKC